MRRGTKAVLGTGVACLGLVVSAALAERFTVSAQAAQSGTARPAATAPTARASAQTPPSAGLPAPMRSSAGTPAQDHNGVIKKYCAGCHNDRRPAAGLSLASFDVAKAVEHAEVAEKMIVKLQAGMMPPRGAPRSRPIPADGPSSG